MKDDRSDIADKRISASTVIEWLGRRDYGAMVEMQHRLVDERARNEIEDRLLLLEHDDVFTVGRGGKDASRPRDDSIPIVEIERGGDVTWHGPGQLVGYWIRKLDGRERDLHRHLRLIEEALIDALGRFGVVGRRESGLTGVWVGEKKLVSIGVAVRRWVTFHGFAFNVSVDRGVFTRFKPCGLGGEVMSDLKTVLGRDVGSEEVQSAVIASFRDLFSSLADPGLRE